MVLHLLAAMHEELVLGPGLDLVAPRDEALLGCPDVDRRKQSIRVDLGGDLAKLEDVIVNIVNQHLELHVHRLLLGGEGCLQLFRALSSPVPAVLNRELGERGVRGVGVLQDRCSKTSNHLQECVEDNKKDELKRRKALQQRNYATHMEEKLDAINKFDNEVDAMQKTLVELRAKVDEEFWREEFPDGWEMYQEFAGYLEEASRLPKRS